MKDQAVLYEEYGPVDVLQIKEIFLRDLKSDEVKVKVKAVALNPKDILVRKGKFKWITGKKFPKLTGLDFAGVVEETDKNGIYKKGQAVYGCLNEFTSLRGTLASHVIVKTKELALMPKNIGFTEAAALPLTAQTSLQALRNIMGLKKNDRILIHGASGGVGVMAIQLAKFFGAIVTTTSSEKNFEFCKSLGADITLDYSKDDFFAKKEIYEAVFDVYGNQCFEKAQGSLTKNGVYVTTVPSKKIIFDALKTLFFTSKARLVYVSSNTSDLNEISKLVESGKLLPVIDEVYSFDDYKKAFARLESKRAKGKVVIELP